MKIPQKKTSALFVVFVFLTNCTLVGKAFQGNTRREFGSYDLNERREYRRLCEYQELCEREKEREILQRLEKGKTADTTEKSSSVVKNPPRNGILKTPKKKTSIVKKFLRRLFHLGD